MAKEASDEGFIGHRYGEHNQVEVLSFEGWRRGKKDRMYSVKCHECAKDPELFDDAIYITHKSTIIRGIVPCGCSTSVRHTEQQNAVLVKRKAVEMNYEFLGFVGEYNGVFTKIRLKCNEDDHIWESNNITNFLIGIGCPKCKSRGTSERFSKSDEEMIASFLVSGRFKEGSKFWKSDRVSNDGTKEHWHYYCPICSHDKYVQSGLCNGVFEGAATSLQRGSAPCRCNPTYRWTSSQREFQINERIQRDNLPYTFVGWLGEYKGFDSRMIMHCEHHGNWETRSDSFLYNGSGCHTCAKSGFDTTKDGWIYVLHATSPVNSFTGYGISNIPKTREKTHRRNLALSGYSLEGWVKFPCGGQDAWNTERLMKNTFPVNSQPINGFRSEATYSQLYEDVISFVKEKLDSASATQ